MERHQWIAEQRQEDHLGPLLSLGLLETFHDRREVLFPLLCDDLSREYFFGDELRDKRAPGDGDRERSSVEMVRLRCVRDEQACQIVDAEGQGTDGAYSQIVNDVVEGKHLFVSLCCLGD